MADKESGLFLGARLDAEGGRTDARLSLDPDDLTTHGVIVGMTGSGKTGLGVVLLEELLRRGTPTLILDPKGDMGNLLLTFPDLADGDFAAWVEPGAARREGISVQELGERTAARWRDGLAGWGLGSEEIAALRERAELTIYTPGSLAGVPLNVVGSLDAPDLDWTTDVEALRDEIEGFVTGLLGLVDVAADPLTSREHILMSNIMEAAWRNGERLDLPGLLTRIQRPPMRKLGVFEVDTFFPERDRLALAMKLNGLIASPAFAAWLAGAPMDIDQLLWTEDGRPRAAVIYLAHLSETERQFVVTLLLSRLITWMRAQPGTSTLRALCYMDEVYGYVPPTAMPPAKKPILTLLKQARAFGVGLVLSTQNPVDLDYKAMSNAGTWMVGRLQTERDKSRVLEALRSARGDVDVAALDRLIGGLGKRQFLFYSARGSEPAAFSTRWAMSFLRGPLTRDEVRRLAPGPPPPSEPAAEGEGPAKPSAPPVAPAPAPEPSAPPVAPAPAPAPARPAVAEGVPVYFLDPAASWSRAVGAQTGGTRLEAALAARVKLVFDERAAKLEHQEEWELVLKPVGAAPDPRRAKVVDYDARDFVAEPPEGATFVLPDAPLHSRKLFNTFASELKRFLHRSRKIEIFANRSLRLYSRVGEERADFEARCDRSAREAADKPLARQRERFARRLDSLRRKLSDAERKLDDAEANSQAQRQETWATGAGSLLDVFLGGRSDTRSMARRAARRARRFSTRQSQSGRAEKRAATARDKVADLRADLAALEDDLADTIATIDAQWSEKAADIETLTVGLEKDDIVVDEVALVWVPVGGPPGNKT